MKNLGAKIREERKALGLTLDHFADLLGTSRSMLQRVETGAKSPTIDQLVEIANICRKPIDEFFSEKPQGFKKFSHSEQKIIRTDNYDVSIICPYGLISNDVVVSYFRGKAGAVVTPQRQKGYYYWVYITKGTCLFELEGLSHKLKKGDAIYYDAEKRHTLKITSPLESIRITIRR